MSSDRLLPVSLRRDTRGIPRKDRQLRDTNTPGTTCCSKFDGGFRGAPAARLSVSPPAYKSNPFPGGGRNDGARDISISGAGAPPQRGESISNSATSNCPTHLPLSSPSHRQSRSPSESHAHIMPVRRQRPRTRVPTFAKTEVGPFGGRTQPP